MLLVFVDVMKELPATLVLRPFDSDTLAVVAYNFARDERLAEAALPSLAIVAVGLIPVAAAVAGDAALKAAPRRAQGRLNAYRFDGFGSPTSLLSDCPARGP